MVKDFNNKICQGVRLNGQLQGHPFWSLIKIHPVQETSTMKAMLFTLLLSVFVAIPGMASEAVSAADMLAMKKLTATEIPDGESEDTVDDSEKGSKKKESLEASDIPDGESEVELDDDDKSKKD
jgi:hypothetical protein